jgi:hypothetical protein
MIFEGLEPQWYITPRAGFNANHLLVVGNLTQLVHLNLFSLVCAINTPHISSHKMIFVGLEPHIV